jgi:hypothetical protein
LPSKLEKLTSAALRWGALLAALWLCAEYVRFALHRIPEPYALRWLETYLYRSAWQAFSGEPLYPAASVDYIAPIYNPLYFLLGGWTFKIAGSGFAALRLLSLAAFALCGAALYRFLRRAGWERSLGFALATLILLIPRSLNFWMSTANLDAPMLALSLWGFFLLRSEQLSGRDAVLSGLLFAGSFLMKQQAAVLVLAAFGYLFLVERRASWKFAAGFLLLAGGAAALLELRSGGVYSATAFALPIRSTTNPNFSLVDWCVQILPAAFGLLLLGVIALMRWGNRRERIFWGLLLAATLTLSYLSGRKSGGTINNLLPYLLICFWAFGEGMAILRARLAPRAWPNWILAAAVLALLGWEGWQIRTQNGMLARAHEVAPGASAYRRFEEFELHLGAIAGRYEAPVFVGGRFRLLEQSGRPIENFHQTALYEGTIRADQSDVERILEAPLRERRYTAMLVWRRPEDEALRAQIERHYVKRATLGRDPLIGLEVDLYEPRNGED